MLKLEIVSRHIFAELCFVAGVKSSSGLNIWSQVSSVLLRDFILSSLSFDDEKESMMHHKAFILLLTLTMALAACGGNRATNQSAASNSTNGAPANSAPAKKGPTVDEMELLRVAGKGDVEAIKALLDKGASVNAQGDDGRTPLMEAAYAGQINAVKLLLERGADPSLKKKDGADALAFSAGHADIAQLFKNDAQLVEAAGKGDNKGVKDALDKGALINAKDQFGHTALSEAAWYGKADTVKLLLEKGADPNVKKADGATPLQLAAAQNHQDIVELLQNGAQSAQGKSRSTPSQK